jgi:hypothetical protein
MVDWADELGIDLATLHVEAFWHPVAQWDNDRIRRRGEDFWEWRRQSNPEPPTPVAVRESTRPSYEFTDRQLQIAMRSLHADI